MADINITNLPSTGPITPVNFNSDIQIACDVQTSPGTHETKKLTGDVLKTTLASYITIFPTSSFTNIHASIDAVLPTVKDYYKKTIVINDVVSTPISTTDVLVFTVPSAFAGSTDVYYMKTYITAINTDGLLVTAEYITHYRKVGGGGSITQTGVGYEVIKNTNNSPFSANIVLFSNLDTSAYLGLNQIKIVCINNSATNVNFTAHTEIIRTTTVF